MATFPEGLEKSTFIYSTWLGTRSPAGVETADVSWIQGASCEMKEGHWQHAARNIKGMW